MAAAGGRFPGDRAASRWRKRWRTGERNVAVIGCGALGLTSATLLQRAGAKVTIYAKETAAGGAVGPRDGIVDAGFADRFDELRCARFSGVVGEDVPHFVPYVRELSGDGGESGGVDGSLCAFRLSPEEAGARRRRQRGEASLEFARYQNRVADLTPQAA